jgi:hypothetical protein
VIQIDGGLESAQEKLKAMSDYLAQVKTNGNL